MAWFDLFLGQWIIAIQTDFQHYSPATFGSPEDESLFDPNLSKPPHVLQLNMMKVLIFASKLHFFREKVKYYVFEDFEGKIIPQSLWSNISFRSDQISKKNVVRLLQVELQLMTPFLPHVLVKSQMGVLQIIHMLHHPMEAVATRISAPPERMCPSSFRNGWPWCLGCLECGDIRLTCCDKIWWCP